jgi:hypothetical protein
MKIITHLAALNAAVSADCFHSSISQDFGELLRSARSLTSLNFQICLKNIQNIFAVAGLIKKWRQITFSSFESVVSLLQWLRRLHLCRIRTVSA